MATILVIDDRPANRDILKTLLGHKSHRVLEAFDGAEALALAKSARPDLVISDSLMPTMDGYEFVRRLRADPEIAGIPVIFNTAHCLDHETRALARASDVTHIIYKPAEPAAVFRAVDAALGISPAGQLGPDLEADRHKQLSIELKLVNERLAALIELGQQLGAEREPLTLLENFCRSARKIVGAKYGAVGVLDEDTKTIRHFLTSGMRPSVEYSLPTTRGLVGKLLTEGGTIKLRDVRESPRGVGLPIDHPEMQSFLGAAITTGTGVLGVFYVADKIGFPEFTNEDKQLVVMLSAQVGVAYENARRFEQIKERTAELTREIAEREVAQIELRASEERFSKAFSASPIPMSIVAHEDGRYIHVNESFLENSGYTRDEIVGRTTSEIGIYAFPEERDRLRHVLEEHGRIRNAEVHRRTKSGEVRIALSSSEMIDIDGGRCVLTANNDITERKRAEESLQSREAQLTSIIGSAMDAIITVDAEQRILLFNTAAEKIFGCSRDEAIGQQLDRFIPERFRGTHRDHIRSFGQAMVTPRSMGSLIPISGLRTSGEEFPIEASISQVDVDGRKLFTVIIRDITARKRAGKELAKKTLELQQHAYLLDLAQVLVRDPNDSRIVLWNRGAEVFYGFTREEALGRISHDLLKTEFPATREEVDAVLVNDGHWEGELTHTRRDGRRVTVASHQVLHRNEHGEPVGILEVNNDISDRKEAERKLNEHALKLSTSEEELRARNEELKLMSGQLWQAAKLAAVGELAASIAHELNNPLAIVSLRIGSLLSQTGENDPKHRALSVVDQEVDRMGKLVRNLLQFSRRGEPQVSTISVLDEIANTLELLHSYLHNRSIKIVLEFSDEARTIQADRQQLRQLFLNVLTNAADSMPHGGYLTIRVAPRSLNGETVGVTIQVADTGVGISPQDLARVTEPFFTTKPEGKGTGLGLAICKRIVQEHRGDFEIMSDPGKGTTVRITLPESASKDDSELIGANRLALMQGL
jgi:PAS domain S-box-containing protein